MVFFVHNLDAEQYLVYIVVGDICYNDHLRTDLYRLLAIQC